MLAYIKFNSSKEFEDWQVQKERKINQISPIVNDISLKTSNSSELEADGEVTFGIFVVYFKD